MDIVGFTTGFRVGSQYPACLNIQPLGGHDSLGVMAFTYDTPVTPHRIEVRRKDNVIALLSFLYNDTELPDWWKDSELLWSNKPEA